MWKKVKCVVAVTMSVLCLASNVSADSIRFSVDTSKTQRTIGLEMYGTGGGFGVETSSTLAVDFPYSKINSKLVNDLKKAGLSFGFYRAADVTSTGYRWKEAIGSVVDRDVNANVARLYNNGISSFGIAEQAKLVQTFEGKEGMINFTINMVEENPIDAADIAEYCYGDGTVNYNGGVNWANVRKSHGIKDPINVFAWELGNEYDAGSRVHMFINSEMYVRQCKEYIAAIRSVKPDAKIAISAPMLSSTYESKASLWTYNALMELAPIIDYVVIHGYVTMGLAYNRDKGMLAMAEELETMSGGRIKIINTEYAAQGTLSEKEGTDQTAWGYGACIYFEGGRTVADALCRGVINKYIACTNYFAASDGTGYSICYYDTTDNKYKPNASGQALSLFQQYGKGELVEFNLEGFELGKKSDCCAIAVKDKDGYLNLIMVNNTNDKDIDIEFDFDKDYAIKEIRKISAPNPQSVNYIGIQQISDVTQTFDDLKKADGYKLEKLSMVALKMKEVNK